MIVPNPMIFFEATCELGKRRNRAGCISGGFRVLAWHRESPISHDGAPNRFIFPGPAIQPEAMDLMTARLETPHNFGGSGPTPTRAVRSSPDWPRGEATVKETGRSFKNWSQPANIQHLKGAGEGRRWISPGVGEAQKNGPSRIEARPLGEGQTMVSVPENLGRPISTPDKPAGRAWKAERKEIRENPRV